MNPSDIEEYEILEEEFFNSGHINEKKGLRMYELYIAINGKEEYPTLTSYIASLYRAKSLIG